MQLPLFILLPKTLGSPLRFRDEKSEVGAQEREKKTKKKNSSLRIISIRFSTDLDPAAPRVVIADGYLIKFVFCLMPFLIQSLLTSPPLLFYFPTDLLKSAISLLPGRTSSQFWSYLPRRLHRCTLWPCCWQKCVPGADFWYARCVRILRLSKYERF